MLVSTENKTRVQHITYRQSWDEAGRFP